ncbi:hypothetical protein PV325_008897, partial [Microctonus aethiopoides]
MDFTKYNLRCNRSISEKMMKKDFIYDIRPPQMMLQKHSEMRPSVSSALSLMEKNNFKRQFSQSNVEFIENDLGAGDAFMFHQRRKLDFECNFCHEPIATFSSLSTHVKSHWKKYCKKCYWILLDNETIEQHNYYNHKIISNSQMIFND